MIAATLQRARAGGEHLEDCFFLLDPRLIRLDTMSRLARRAML